MRGWQLNHAFLCCEKNIPPWVFPSSKPAFSWPHSLYLIQPPFCSIYLSIHSDLY